MFPASRLAALVDLSASRTEAVRDHAGRIRARRTATLAAAALALCAALVYLGARVDAPAIAIDPQAPSAVPAHADLNPMAVMLKLGSAALIGLLVTAVYRHVRRGAAASPSMDQAQTLLCVSGALMMIIIGNSLARAFGIAGAAAIIRFRTPVDDPKDASVLFLLLALGMAAGIGALPLAGLGALCVCALIPILDRFAGPTPALRALSIDIVAKGSEFPSAHVARVFSAHGISVEPREMVNGDQARVRYHASIDPAMSLDEITSEILQSGQVLSLAWDIRKKG